MRRNSDTDDFCSSPFGRDTCSSTTTCRTLRHVSSSSEADRWSCSHTTPTSRSPVPAASPLRGEHRQERHVAFQLDPPSLRDGSSNGDEDAIEEHHSSPGGKARLHSPRYTTRVAAAPRGRHHRLHPHHFGADATTTSNSSASNNTSSSTGLAAAAATTVWNRADVAALRELALQHHDDLSRVATGLGYEVVAQVPRVGSSPTAAFDIFKDLDPDPVDVNVERASRASNVEREPRPDGLFVVEADSADDTSHQLPSLQRRTSSHHHVRVAHHQTGNADTNLDALYCEANQALSLDASPLAASSTRRQSCAYSAPDRSREADEPVGGTGRVTAPVGVLLLQPTRTVESPAITTAASSSAAQLPHYPVPGSAALASVGRATDNLPPPRFAASSAAAHAVPPPPPPPPLPPSILRRGVVPVVSTTANSAATVAFDPWTSLLGPQRDSPNNSTSGFSSRGASIADEAAALVMPFLGVSSTRGRGLALDGWTLSSRPPGTLLFTPDESHSSHPRSGRATPSAVDLATNQVSERRTHGTAPMGSASTAATTPTNTTALTDAERADAGPATLMGHSGSALSHLSDSRAQPLLAHGATLAEPTPPFTLTPVHTDSSSSGNIGATQSFNSPSGVARVVDSLEQWRQLNIPPGHPQVPSLPSDNGLFSSVDAVNLPHERRSDSLSSGGSNTILRGHMSATRAGRGAPAVLSGAIATVRGTADATELLSITSSVGSTTVTVPNLPLAPLMRAPLHGETAPPVVGAVPFSLTTQSLGSDVSPPATAALPGGTGMRGDTGGLRSAHWTVPGRRHDISHPSTPTTTTTTTPPPPINLPAARARNALHASAATSLPMLSPVSPSRTSSPVPLLPSIATAGSPAEAPSSAPISPSPLPSVVNPR